MVVHEKSKLIYKNNIFEAKDIQDYIDNIKSILLTKDNIFDNVIAIEKSRTDFCNFCSDGFENSVYYN
jgi:hypothetical protein